MRWKAFCVCHRRIRSSPDYRQPVLEALCAFVREHTIGMTVADHPTTDVQAVLTVIGRRPKELKPVDLSGADLSGAYLIRPTWATPT